MLEVEGTSGLWVSPQLAALVAPSAWLFGGRSAGVIKGSKIMVPFMWADITAAPYDQLQSALSYVYTLLSAQAWLAPYEPSKRAQVRFTYRSSVEYDTLSPTETDPNGMAKFYVYQAAWAFMGEHGAPQVPAPVTWPEYSIENTRRWPGTEAWPSSYVRLTEEKNVISDTGEAKIRKEVAQNTRGGPLKVMPTFDDYQVAPSN